MLGKLVLPNTIILFLLLYLLIYFRNINIFGELQSCSSDNLQILIHLKLPKRRKYGLEKRSLFPHKEMLNRINSHAMRYLQKLCSAFSTTLQVILFLFKDNKNLSK